VSFEALLGGLQAGASSSRRRRSAPPTGILDDDRPQVKEKMAMRWYHYLAYFFGGLFLANAFPHWTQGISGHAFQSPFASPPGEGLSTAPVNVLWGLANFAVAYLLTARVGRFDLRNNRHALPFFVGMVVISLVGAWHFGRFHGGL
jgi:hypothetical protein